ncbi:MAG: hypothetical protein QNI96_13290 [Woeseiaceae bacterium]|nr:hypothetical protein [Woeseiaceae bacterium]
MRRVTLIALLVACRCVEADGTAPVFVFVGISEPAAAELTASNSTAAAATKFLDNEDIANRNTRAALDVAGWDGFETAVLEQFGCFGIGEAPCRNTTVIGPDVVESREQGGSEANGDSALAAVVAQLFIDTQPIARVSFLKSRKKGRLKRISRLNIQYFDPPEMAEDEAAYPFYADPGKVTDEERETLAASRALWFSGDPSPLQSVLRGFVDSVPRVLDHVYEDLATQKKPFDLRTWYAGLKPLKSYAKTHDFDCRINDCETRLLRIVPDVQQAWVARYYDSDLVVRVVPCAWVWCEPD